MRFICDHDLHIHSYVSPCSGDPEQNPDNILKYAVENGFKTVCLTDHYWDDSVPSPARPFPDGCQLPAV